MLVNVKYKSDFVVKLIAPTDTENQIALNDAAGVVSCTFSCYDPAKDETLSAAEAPAQTVISVTNAGVFVVGDVLEIVQDSGVVKDMGAITAVSTSAGTVTCTNPLDTLASLGARARVRLGAMIGMSEYGTAKLGLINWGYKATLPDTHAGLVPDLVFDIEISFNGGAGLALRSTINAKVSNDAC
jgi:hypothetical protein